MRKAILATACIALVAGGMAIGVTQADKIQSFFASKEMYKNHETTEQTTTADATQTTTAPATPATDQTTTPETAAPAQEETTAVDASGSMTPVDLNKNLNDQTPAAGEEAAKDEAAAAAADEAKVQRDANGYEIDTTPEKTMTQEAVDNPPAAEEAPKYQVDVAKALANRSVGSANAKLVVNDFSSLSCPHCAAFHKDVYPKIKEKYIDTGKVRWVFHSFPLNDAALKADMVARCAPGGDDEYFKLSDFIFANQERWAFTDQPIPNLNMLLKVAGVTDDVFLACINNKELEAGLLKSAQEASQKYKIEATPSFVLNDGMKVFSGAGTYEGFAFDLDKALEALGEKKTSSPAVVPSNTLKHAEEQ